ncbi:unnamed protein product [Leuciscus chuanchicus]
MSEAIFSPLYKNTDCFQYGLKERQILELLQGLDVTKTTSPNERENSADLSYPEPSEEDGGIRQKDVEKDDICPICQEELLLKKLPVTYCKFSCGNNIHISCMKVWADHQTKRDPCALPIKCPLCREDFGTFKQLIEQVKNAGELLTYYERDCLDKHLGVMCNICRACPIIGKCFKCTECSYFHLCEDCFKRRVHPKHYFIVRMVLNVESASQDFNWVSMSEPFPANTRKSNCCPLDWHVIYNPLTWSPRSGRTERSLAPSSDVQRKRTDEQLSEFFLPGIGLQVKKGSAPSLMRTVTSEPSVCSPSSVDSLTQGFRGLCINSSHIEPYTRMFTMKHNHTKEKSSLHRSFSGAKAAPAERRGSFPNSPSTVSLTLKVQSALPRTQNDQQRLIVGINGPFIMTPAYGRIRPLRKDPLRQKPRPDRLDRKDLHL